MAKITWTDKTALNPQPSVARENKCTDADLNEIKSVVNTNDDNVGDLTNLDTTTKTSLVDATNELHGNYEYSTTEVNTHKKWIDGKTIYRKVNTYSSYSLIAGQNSLSTGISNMETLVNSRFYMKYSDVWFVDWADNGFTNQVYSNNGSLYEAHSQQSLTVDLILITEYTKTS